MSPHLTCQTDVQPATIGFRMYRKVQESRLVGGASSQSWAAQNISIVTLMIGSHAVNVSVRTMALIAGETSQQEYSVDAKITYSMMIAGFVSTPLSGLYAFCVQGSRELPNVCQLPVSVTWNPSDIKIYDVEFVLSAAIRPSCLQSSFLNSPMPNKSIKMFQLGVIDYDDSFLTIPIPSVPPIGSHLFAQFHVEASVKSGTIQIVCKYSYFALHFLS
jgi:hypothetical protein